MFDVGFSELLLLAVLGLLILGPERLPAVAKTLGTWVRRGRRMAREFQYELEKEVDLQSIRDLKKDIDDAAQPFKDAGKTLDEGHSILDNTIKSEWQGTSDSRKAPAADKAVAKSSAVEKSGEKADG